VWLASSFIVCRKTRLLVDAVGLCDRARQWERGIALLAAVKQHALARWDYARAAEYLVRPSRMPHGDDCLTLRQRTEAALCEQIATVDRAFPFYYRVAFWGRGMPPEYRVRITPFAVSSRMPTVCLPQGRAYIYRGREGERNMDFERRMKTRFPEAAVLKTSADPGDDVRESDGQCASPHRHESAWLTRLCARHPDHVREYVQRGRDACAARLGAVGHRGRAGGVCGHVPL
jgi:hypothetical protein